MTDPNLSPENERPAEPATPSPINPVFVAAARQFLLIPALGKDLGHELDHHRVTMPQIVGAFTAVYEAGRKQRVAEELGIEHVVHSRDLPRFPWQVHGKDGRCDLFDKDFKNHTRIRSSYSPAEDRPHTVPLDQAPTELLDAVRAARSKDITRTR